MKNIIKKSLITALTIATFLGSSLSIYAAPKTMPDGTVFDAEFYAAANPDVVQAFGTDETALYNHYLAYGKAEGRLPYAVTPAAEPAPAPAVTPNPQKSDETSPIIIDPSGNVLFVYPETNCQGLFNQIHKKFIKRRFFWLNEKLNLTCKMGVRTFFRRSHLCSFYNLEG